MKSPRQKRVRGRHKFQTTTVRNLIKFLLSFFLDKKERKNQEQTIAPHRQHNIAFVQSSRALSELNIAQKRIISYTADVHKKCELE